MRAPPGKRRTLAGSIDARRRGRAIACKQANPYTEAGSRARVDAVGREYEPVAGKWYRDLEEEESFHVLSVDEDQELIEIQHLDGDIEEIDLDTWAEMDVEPAEEPEGWSGSADEDDDYDEDEEWDEDEDDDWDDDDEDDDDDDAGEDDRDRDDY
jgi:hypothetical protein